MVGCGQPGTNTEQEWMIKRDTRLITIPYSLGDKTFEKSDFI